MSLDFNKFTFKLNISICFILFPLMLSAAPDQTSTESLDKLVARLKKIETFSGSFVQESVDQKQRRVQESRGELKAQRPGLFYWHTKEPLEQVVYSDGKNVTVYDPDLEQATIQKVSDQSQNTPAILFSGDVERIGDLFEVQLREFDEKTSQFLLIPKVKESLFERLKIRFEGSYLKEMHLTDALGQVSALRFVYSEINLKFPKDTFKPNLPEGTDIIRDVPFVSADSTEVVDP